jgi:hypothetical protein
MKYQVGDLLLIKDCIYKPRPRPRPRPRPELFNSFGIITQAFNHNDYWKGETTSDDKVYVWFSQLDAREYSFCEDEVIGEVIK